MLDETDVKDDQGNIVISPGLKVRHKSSQFEYTVDDVVNGPEGEINVILKMPEEPRFDPPEEEQEVIQDNRESSKFLNEVDPSGLYVMTDEEVDDDQPMGPEELLSVPQAEFEKDYEVK